MSAGVRRHDHPCTEVRAFAEADGDLLLLDAKCTCSLVQASCEAALMDEFYSRTVHSWEHFLDLSILSSDEWIFRGQSSDWSLKTSLERACESSDISLEHAPFIETSLIDNFRRRYDGNDRQFVIDDTLYCLALMQHHGAPTRLLDWTYSPYIAFYFAIENGGENSVIWCLNRKWWMKRARDIVGSEKFEQRVRYETRNDSSFLPLYMTGKPYKMVYLENPYFFNSRLNIQQGVFLCAGDVRSPYEENLRALPGCCKPDAVVKIQCRMEMQHRLQALKELHRMNIHRESLFPGLDGFAQALAHRLWIYLKFQQ